MWDFFIRNRYFSYLLMFALIGFGLFAVATIPKESSPEVQIPIGVVSVSLPGASALDMENLVTNELERGIDGAVGDIQNITSTSRDSSATIIVEFSARADIDESIRELRDRVDQLQPNLPDGATNPVVSDIDFVDQPIVTLGVSGNRSPEDFIALAEALEDEMLSISGVSRVEVSGVRERAIYVAIDQLALSQYNLQLSEVVQALRAANTALPIGEIVSDNIRYNIAFAGTLDTAEDISDTPITLRGTEIIYVRERATITDGVQPARTINRLSVAGQPSDAAITLDIYKQRDADIITTSAAALTAAKDFIAAGDYDDVALYPLTNAGEMIRTDLIELSITGFQTALLVTLLLIVAIGWREALIAGTAIPLSFTIGFIGLLLSGNTINFISLFALILGIGILVDSSIVMVEGINKRMKENPTMNKQEIAISTIQTYSKPVIAGTLTTVAMFSGLFVVSGIIGQFISSIPYTLIFVLFASLLVAVGFVPLLASTFLRRRSTSKYEDIQRAYTEKFEQWYTKEMYAFLANTKQRILFVSGLIVALISSFILIPLGLVEVIFFGEGDAPYIFMEVELPSGTTQSTTDRTLRSIEEALYDQPEIAAFSTTVGAGSAFGDGASGATIGSIFIELDPERERGSTAIADDIRQNTAHIQNAEIIINQPDAGPPTGAPLEIKIVGTDLDEIATVTRAISALLRDTENVTNVTDSSEVGNTEYVFQFDRLQAGSLGIQPQAVTQLLRTAIVGTEATTITSLVDDTPVIVRVDFQPDERFNVDTANHTDIPTLLNLSIPTATGETAFLDSVIDTSVRAAQSQIEHDNRERVMRVSADVASGTNVRELNASLQSRIGDEIAVPDSITVSFAGETEESDEAFGELFLALIVGIALMLGVLVLQFNSYRYPIYVLSIVPFSLIGILYGLAIVGSPLSFPSIMGFIALTGIVVNNSILLIDMINQGRRTNPEQPVRDTVVQAASNRLRPILLTTITTVVGITPLLFTDPIWVPLATAIMFGLSFSVVVTLIFIPLLYDKYPGTVR